MDKLHKVLNLSYTPNTCIYLNYLSVLFKVTHTLSLFRMLPVFLDYLYVSWDLISISLVLLNR